MDYTEARRTLARLPFLEVKPGLARIHRLLDALGHPEASLNVIHVAGTNGKGSVVAMLDAVLEASGYRVGRFTSPELVDFRDRIAVDGRWISEVELADGVAALLRQLEDVEDPPTLFEALTALAFRHFARTRVDVVLAEAGLGGRFDATNVTVPILTILTNVGRDHLGILGNTTAEIAWEKAGIAKRGIPLLHGALDDGPRGVVMEEARRAGASLVSTEGIGARRTRFDWETATYRIRGAGLPEGVDLPLLGGAQQENLRLALQALRLLRERGTAITDAAIVEGLAAVRWPGRFEVVRRRPEVVVDGAHNVPAIEWIVRDAIRYVPDRGRRHLVFGILADKEVGPICAALLPHFSDVLLVQPDSPRALPVGDLARRVGQMGVSAECAETVSEGLQVACRRLSCDDMLLVTGSLAVVRDARAALGGADA